MKSYIATQADKEICHCLIEKRSFSVVAGAGSGKTTSLVEALKSLLKLEGPRLLRDGQRVVCITYTNRAADVISGRLRQDPLFVVSTLHKFLWGEIRNFQTSILESLRRHVLPTHIAKQEEKDNGGKSKTAIAARQKAAELKQALGQLDAVESFRYGDTPYSDYLNGELGHDDLVAIAADMIKSSRALRRVLGQKYPYFFVDEAQDTSSSIVDALNALCTAEGLPIVGYFGDPMQQIYDQGKGDFKGPEGSARITKGENYRSAPEVITLLNAFRKDITQVAAGDNASIAGSVNVTLVESESPEGARKRYSEAQLERAAQRLIKAIERWGWVENQDAKQLFLARRMIARRLGFLSLHDLFDGPYASSRAKNAYEEGEHFLLKPFVETIVPLARAHRSGSTGAVLTLLTTKTVAFAPNGDHADKPTGDVRQLAKNVTETLVTMLGSCNLGKVLQYCLEQRLCRVSEQLAAHLDRKPREEDYDEEVHTRERSDWLADAFFSMSCGELENYCDFLDENTPFSTQHGVKGEEYEDVIVVFDDIEASWHNYTFAKMLTPGVSGTARPTQDERSRKLAYVCFSRAVRNLRVLLFTPNPKSARDELIGHELFPQSQITLLD